MAKSKRTERQLPDIQAIATRAERNRPRSPKPSVREAAAKRRRQTDEERQLRNVVAGFVDVPAIERLAEAREKADVKRVETTHRRAVEDSRRNAQWIATRGIPVTVLAPIDGEGQFTIDTAAWMRAWPNTGALKDFSTAAGNNWARYRIDIDGDILDVPDEARLSFYALWQNREDVDVTVRVGTRVDVNSYIHAHADGRRFSSWFIPGASADATLRARLTVFPLWLSDTQFTVAEEFVGSVSARGGFLGDDDDATIFTSVLLDGSLSMSVPQGRFLMLESSLVSGWKLDSGSFRVDAQQGAFRVAVPYRIVTKVT